ncbi:MAG: glycoside hydrolase family 2 protein, partial [Roseburia sp.]|nr:glycoside hydrolase family 2 protein [Roseburia sp.]
MKIQWNNDWLFSKETGENARWEAVNLPHTWNGIDGQDGGNDYYRGTCSYRKTLHKSELPGGKQIYLEVEGANSSAEIYVNG